MENRICIVGIGVVESAEAANDLSHKELLFHATREALNDAGLERKDIDGAITSSYDFLEGRSLSNQYSLDSIGGVMKPCDMRLGEDGMHGLFAAYMHVLVDPNQIVVAASVMKASELGSEGLNCQELIAATMDPVFARPVCRGVPHFLSLESVLAAMEARAFIERTGLGEEHIAEVAVKNLNNADSSKKSDRISRTAVMESDLLSWPIRRLMRAREADAACTLILASEKRAKRLASEPIFIRGVGWCSGRSHFSSRQPGVCHETKWAAHRAYHMARIARPSKEIDLAEVSDWYAHRELMHCEALGLCGSDEITNCSADGRFEKNGVLPVNPSGGLLGRGNAIGTSGLICVARVARQLRGQANEHQVAGAEVGLAHGWSGIPTATVGVTILSKW